MSNIVNDKYIPEGNVIDFLDYTFYNVSRDRASDILNRDINIYDPEFHQQQKLKAQKVNG